MLARMGGLMEIRLILLSVLILLSPSHLFAQDDSPTSEFLSGHKAVFSTEGHPKAMGVNLSMAYPSSWAAKEGERPHIVQKMVSEGGHGGEVVVILVGDLPLPPGVVPTTAEIREMFAPSELRGMLPDGAVLIDAQPTKIEGIPAGTLEFTMRAARAGVSVATRTWMLCFISGRALVQLSFTISSPVGDEAALTRRMATFKPLFTLMANSVVLPDRWTAGGVSRNGQSDLSRSSNLPSDGGASPQSDVLNPSEPLVAQVLIGLGGVVISWVVGLSLPLVVRYVFARRRLSRQTASWIAAGWSICLWLVGIVISTAIGERPSGSCGFHIILFFVTQWLMSGVSPWRLLTKSRDTIAPPPPL